jgi:hypothetical protein
MKLSSIAVLILLASVASLAQDKPTQLRVYVEATQGHVYVGGVDHAVPRLEAYGHNQTMELAKTFLQRCPEVIPSLNEDKADFKVTLNFAARTRFFTLGKLVHKPDQIIVSNRDGDVIFSGVARSLGGDTQDACRAIMSSAHPPQHRDPLTVPSASGVPATKPEPPTVPTETADQTGPGPKGKAYQCSVYTVDRLGMKNCTKWVVK